MLTFKPKETLTEQVAQHIEDLIAFGQLESGQRIYESAMAKDLDVSHGSVREALLLLEKRHLVRNVPRRGAFVTELDEDFVRSLYEVMHLYLSHTGRIFVRDWTPPEIERLESLYSQMRGYYKKGQLMEFLELGVEYTQTSVGYANNYFISSAIRDLWPSAKRCAFVALRQGTAMLEDTLQHIEGSLEAIKRRDEEAVLKIFDDYVANQCQQVLDNLPSRRPKDIAR